MKSSAFAVVFVFLASMFYTPEADARRFGGGGSFGRTSPSLFKNYSAPKKAAPTGSATQNTKQQGATTQSPSSTGATAAPARKPFMGPLGGLAAGLGLAALFGFLGFGEGMASFLGTMLMFVLGFFLIRTLFRMLAGANAARPAYQAQGGAPLRREELDFPQYPASVNSGKPNYQNVQAVEPGAQEVAKQLPAGFDESAFLESAKRFFVMIQSEFDKGDLDTLREYCTDDVLQFAKQEFIERGDQENVTSVVTLEAELVGFETDVDEELATVAFSALIREERDAAAHEIHELWIMSRPKQGGGWLLAGIHNL